MLVKPCCTVAIDSPSKRNILASVLVSVSGQSKVIDIWVNVLQHAGAIHMD